MQKSQQAGRRAVRGCGIARGKCCRKACKKSDVQKKKGTRERLSVFHTQMTINLLTWQLHDDVKMVLGKRWKDLGYSIRWLIQWDADISDRGWKTLGKSQGRFDRQGILQL